MKDRVVFITGASSGIGQETAYRFAREGARLVLTYNRGKTNGIKTEKQCQKLGAADTLLIHLDVMDDKSITDAIKQTINKYRGIDVLINNAGTGRFIPFKKQSTGDIEKQIRTNLEGLIKMTRAAISHVRKAVINIASAAGKEAYSDLVVYCATKFGVRGFTQGLALEYPHLSICAVNPDETATRLSGYVGRPPSKVADIIFRTASGGIICSHGGDVDVWEILD